MNSMRTTNINAVSSHSNLYILLAVMIGCCFSCQNNSSTKSKSTSQSTPNTPHSPSIQPNNSDAPEITPSSTDPNDPQGSTSTPNEPCLNGSENCACYPNGSCDPKDGVPMACIDGRCVDQPLIESGTLGGACDAQTSCDAFQGQALSCVNGRCAIASCPSGQMGCPCGERGACLPKDGERGMCVDQFCVPFGCDAGEERCSCDQGACGEGLSCDLNVCRRVSQVNIALDVGQRIRACDLLFEVDEGKVELRPNDQIMAKMSRRGRKVGVSLIARADVALPEEALSLVLDRPASISPDAERLILIKSRCYDRLGHPDERAEARIQ